MIYRGPGGAPVIGMMPPAGLRLPGMLPPGPPPGLPPAMRVHRLPGGKLFSSHVAINIVVLISSVGISPTYPYSVIIISIQVFMRKVLGFNLGHGGVRKGVLGKGC